MNKKKLAIIIVAAVVVAAVIVGVVLWSSNSAEEVEEVASDTESVDTNAVTEQEVAVIEGDDVEASETETETETTPQSTTDTTGEAVPTDNQDNSESGNLEDDMEVVEVEEEKPYEGQTLLTAMASNESPLDKYVDISMDFGETTYATGLSYKPGSVEGKWQQNIELDSGSLQIEFTVYAGSEEVRQTKTVDLTSDRQWLVISYWHDENNQPNITVDLYDHEVGFL